MANRWPTNYVANKKHPLYITWKNMRQRCNNKNYIQYPDYGGRGIYICSDWSDFKNFVRDMEPTFMDGMTLDRINNDGPYEKLNCRWASKKEQAINRRNTKFYKIGNTKLTLTDWAQKLNINRSTLAQRIYVYKWPAIKALTI